MKSRIPAILVLALCVMAQEKSQQQQQQQQEKAKESPPPKKEEPAQLFTGKLGIRSSKTTKESATLGFNGIDPSGKVDEKMLATTPTDAQRAKVRELASQRPTPAELQAFLEEGGLKKK